jgi:hypothetical protein
MTEMKTRTRKGIYRQRLNDGLGKKFRVQVTVTYVDYFIGGKWMKTLSAEECKKIENAVKKKCPDWYRA